MLPKFLIVEVGPALQQFLAVVRAPNMPTIDYEAALSQVIEAVIEPGLDDRLYNAVYFMCSCDGLFSFESFDDPSQACPEQLTVKLIHAVVTLGDAVKENLTHLHAYRDGISPFTFRSLINDTTVLLARSPPDASTATCRHGEAFSAHPTAA